MNELLNLDVEGSLRTYYSLNFNNLISSLEEMPSDPMKKIKGMESPDRYMLCLNKSPQDIYYSNYKETLNRQPELAENPMKLSGAVIKKLWEKGMDYLAMIECAASDPQLSGFDKDMRWAGAVMNVSNAVNPLIAQPEVANAKSLFTLGPESDSAEIYNAFLKHYISEEPSKKLVELDPIILDSMKKQGLNDDRIKQCFREGSPLFVVPEIEDDMERFNTINAINKQFDEYYEKLEKSSAHEEKEVRVSASSDEHEDEVYTTLYSYIESLKEEHEKGNLEQYWRNSLKEINTALDIALQYQNQVKQALKILKLWADGLDRASKEFGIENNEELPKIKASIKEMIAKADNANNGWENVFSMLEKVTEVTKLILDKEKNPLLSEITELRNAKPLRIVIDKGKENDIYFSALKEELAKNPKINIKQADILVISRLMLKTKLSVLKISGILSHSPQFKELTTKEKLASAKKLYVKARQKINQIKERRGKPNVKR